SRPHPPYPCSSSTGRRSDGSSRRQRCRPLRSEFFCGWELSTRACGDGFVKANSGRAYCRDIAVPFPSTMSDQANDPPPAGPTSQRSHKILALASIVILVPIVIFSLWTWVTLG